MGKSRCWEVWWAAVKFEENDTKKERPIVFLRDHDYGLTVQMNYEETKERRKQKC